MPAALDAQGEPQVIPENTNSSMMRKVWVCPVSSDSKLSLQGQRSPPRRSQRLYIQIQVRVEWRLENNTAFNEETETFVVNAHGALVRLDAVPPLGHKIILQNASTNETEEAIVVFASKTPAKDGKFNVGIEFIKPNASFWHVSFPPEDWSTNHPDAKPQREE